MFSFIARHKIASLMVFLNVIAILVVVLIIVLHNAKTATISIYVAPSEAVIELNGGEYDNFQEYDVMPGKYHVKISMEEMETKEFDFEIFDGEFKRIKTYLLDSEGGFSYYLENPDEVLVLKEAVTKDGLNSVPKNDDEQDKNALEFATKFLEKEAAEQNLPISYTSDSVDNGFGFASIDIRFGNDEECKTEVDSCIVIYDVTGGNYDMALDLMRQNGLRPEDYEIIYRSGLTKEKTPE